MLTNYYAKKHFISDAEDSVVFDYFSLLIHFSTRSLEANSLGYHVLNSYVFTKFCKMERRYSWLRSWWCQNLSDNIFTVKHINILLTPSEIHIIKSFNLRPEVSFMEHLLLSQFSLKLQSWACSILLFLYLSGKFLWLLII